ncbi:hypothetical protein [Streptomyces chartreusis]|uniref:hypothetical protein n=1 Tax=Streptomyces chartreusis TaxID=1969 RepID=UPI003657F526
MPGSVGEEARIRLLGITTCQGEASQENLRARDGVQRHARHLALFVEDLHSVGEVFLRVRAIHPPERPGGA